MGSVTWTAIGVTAGTVYTIAFVLSLRMLARQLRGQTLSDVYERLQSDDVLKARALLFELDDKKVSCDKWDQSAIEAVEKVCQRYDYFAKMVRYHFVRKELVLNSWAWQVDRLWRIAKPFVQSRRLIPGQGRLWEDFQWFADRSSRWVSKNNC